MKLYTTLGCVLDTCGFLVSCIPFLLTVLCTNMFLVTMLHLTYKCVKMTTKQQICAVSLFGVFSLHVRTLVNQECFNIFSIQLTSFQLSSSIMMENF